METLVKEKVTLKTSELQELVSKASKICSYIEGFVTTSSLQIIVADGKLTITSTDNVNILKLQKSGIEGNLHVVVNTKLFSTLVSKLTTPITELELVTTESQGTKLVIRANGNYDIPTIVEEDGSKVTFGEFDFNRNVVTNLLSKDAISSILTMNKSCKAEMKEVPSLYNYYMDSERVITTDLLKACNNPIKVFDRPVCLPPALVESLPLLADDNGVVVYENDNTVLFTSKNGELFGRKAVQEDLDNYPASDLVDVFNSSLQYTCTLNKTLLMNALDRICLFTQGFDANLVNLNFLPNQLKLTTKDCDSTESISYLQPSNLEGTFTIALDGASLSKQLASCPKEDLKINFGNDSGIQIVCDNIVQTLGALDDEEVEGV